MPEVGEIISGRLVGRKESRKVKWALCPECSKGRWVGLNDAKRTGYTGRCSHCARRQRGGGKLHKGGRWTGSQGYVYIRVQPEDFFFSMARDGYVLEHRLVMAKHLGRCLHAWEIVHHLNHKRDENCLSNLQLVTDDRHKQITILENRIRLLEKRLTILETENDALRKEVRARI